MIESDASGSIFLQNIFIGVILTATSVSITVETLKSLENSKPVREMRFLEQLSLMIFWES